MNKEEYMEKLREALKDFDSEVSDEIISDYEEHFAAGVANGKSEEQVSQELGSIEDLVNELKDLKGENTTNAKEDKKDGFSFEFDSESITQSINDVTKGIATFLGAFAATITKGASSVGESVANGAGDFAGSFVKGFENVSEKVVKKTTEFADEVVESYKNTRGFDEETEGEAESVDVDGTKAGEGSCSVKDCNAIIVEGDCADINVDASADGTISVEYSNNGSANQKLAYGFESYTKGNIFYVKVKRKAGSTSFFKSLNCPSIDLDIKVPAGLELIELSTASGDINVTDVDARKLKLHNASGDENVESSVFGTVECNNVSGDIEFDDVNVVKFAGSSISGDIEFNGAAEEIKVNSTSGDIDIDARNLINVAASTVSGDISIEADECSGYVAKVSSVSGSSCLSWHEGASVDAKNGTHTFGNGSLDITAHSVSGDIDINA